MKMLYLGNTRQWNRDMGISVGQWVSELVNKNIKLLEEENNRVLDVKIENYPSVNSNCLEIWLLYDNSHLHTLY